MKYKSTCRATFVRRENRFTAVVLLDGKHETVHVKNTGRLKELLVENANVVLSHAENPARKTRFDLVAVESPSLGTVNIDSQIANDVAEEYLRHLYPHAKIAREVTKGASRFDFCITEGEHQTFLEVKGVTLVRDGDAYFPDAPTERGVKHIKELIACAADGFGAKLLFVVQLKGACCVRPNDETHAAFGAALREASAASVSLLAVDCLVTDDEIVADKPLPVIL